MKSLFLVTMVLSCLLLPGINSAVLAQTPQPPQPQLPAVIDTATVEITLPEGSAACVSVTVSPDTLGFGMGGILTLEFDDPSFLPLAEEMKLSAPWLKLSDGPESGSATQVNECE